jgi:hypothetical protein
LVGDLQFAHARALPPQLWQETGIKTRSICGIIYVVLTLSGSSPLVYKAIGGIVHELNLLVGEITR